jgi:hypothetical protein
MASTLQIRKMDFSNFAQRPARPPWPSYFFRSLCSSMQDGLEGGRPDHKGGEHDGDGGAVAADGIRVPDVGPVTSTAMDVAVDYQGESFLP